MRWLDDEADEEVDRIEAAINTPDEPFCGELAEHQCGGADCQRRPTRRDVGFAGRE